VQVTASHPHAASTTTVSADRRTNFAFLYHSLLFAAAFPESRPGSLYYEAGNLRLRTDRPVIAVLAVLDTDDEFVVIDAARSP
jgi:hypothetical protein